MAKKKWNSPWEIIGYINIVAIPEAPTATERERLAMLRDDITADLWAIRNVENWTDRTAT